MRWRLYLWIFLGLEMQPILMIKMRYCILCVMNGFINLFIFIYYFHGCDYKLWKYFTRSLVIFVFCGFSIYRNEIVIILTMNIIFEFKYILKETIAINCWIYLSLLTRLKWWQYRWWFSRRWWWWWWRWTFHELIKLGFDVWCDQLLKGLRRWRCR